MGKLPVKAAARDKESHIANQRRAPAASVVNFCRLVRMIGIRPLTKLANRMLLQPLAPNIKVILQPLLLLIADSAQRRPL